MSWLKYTRKRVKWKSVNAELSVLGVSAAQLISPGSERETAEGCSGN